jgi:hypothetical protein
MCMCHVKQNIGDEKTVTLDFLGHSYENSSFSACNRDTIPVICHFSLNQKSISHIFCSREIIDRFKCVGEYDDQSADERERGLRAFEDILPIKALDVIIRKCIYI